MHYDELQAALQRAYELLKSGQRQHAYGILSSVCRHHPESTDAWWLMAHAVENPRYRLDAIEQLLALDPTYPRAAEKHAQIRALLRHQASPSQSTSRTTPLEKHARTGYWLAVLALSLFLFSIILGGVLVVAMRNQAPELSQALANVVGTSAAEQRNGIGPGGLAGVFTAPVATPDPAQFGDTYWQGSGDDFTMESQAVDGRYLRFYEFPITVYVEGATSPQWNAHINTALADLNQVVDIELTNERDGANILLEIRDSNTVQRECEVLAFTRVVGCASIEYRGGLLRKPVIRGHAIIATDTNNPTGTILHELMHALGVVVHSPHRTDIMYFEETPYGAASLTQRDLNTLQRLYASPSYAD